MNSCVPSDFDVIVVGGGAVGMSIAWRLGRCGRRVLLLDRGGLGQEASSAAAGMLGAQLEVSEPGPFYGLCLESRALYPDFAADLLEETGIDVQLNHNGIIQIAQSETEVEVLRDQQRWQTHTGSRAEWWSADDVSRAVPLVNPGFGGLYLPDDGNISAPQLTRALAAAVKRRCTVLEHTPVMNINLGGRSGSDADGVSVSTGSGAYHAKSVVICAGAWATPFLEAGSPPLTVSPVKGQLLALRPRRPDLLPHTVFTHDVYLVPKRDGTIVVGATEEHGAGFDKRVTTAGLSTLLDAVRRVAPGLEDAAFERAWVGLRPRLPDGLPRIGQVPTCPAIHVAVGHFRNGILLSPVTALMIEHALNGGPVPERWEPFTPVHHAVL